MALDLGDVFGDVIRDVGARISDRFFGDDDDDVRITDSLPTIGTKVIGKLVPDGAGGTQVVNVRACPRRRRRRSLVTPSEINQLAALQAVLGKGVAFQTWLATRKL